MTKADRILAHKALDFDRSYLHEDLDVPNPFENASLEQNRTLCDFYHKFYNDNTARNSSLELIQEDYAVSPESLSRIPND